METYCCIYINTHITSHKCTHTHLSIQCINTYRNTMNAHIHAQKKRKKEKNKDNKTIDDKANIKDLTNYYGHTKDCITTNNALRDFIIRAFDIFSNENDEKNSKIDEKIAR